MAITTLLTINSIDVTQYLSGYTLQRNKLWTDAGRNLAGDLRSTFIGIFPKILVEFKPLTKSEMASVVTLLDNPSFTVVWFDPKTQTTQSGTFYAGDFDIPLYSAEKELYEKFNVNLIAFNKLA